MASITNRLSGGGLPGRDYTGASGYIKPSSSLDFGGDSYKQRMYESAARDATTRSSMSYGKLPQEPGEDWNAWRTRQSDFDKALGGGYDRNAMDKLLGLDSASRGPTTRSSSGGGGGGGGGGYAMPQIQSQPVEFYLGPAPTMEELSLNFEEMGKRAMEANKPYAEQYKQFAPGTEAGTRALSQAGATMATGQFTADMASQIGRGAAQLGLSTGLGGRSGIGRNILARDLGLGTLQAQQMGADLLSRSSQIAQQAQQAMSPIGPTEVFGTAANQASINQQIRNQNLLNAWQSQGLPGQFDIKKGQYIGFQPGSYSQYRPELQQAPTTTTKTDAYGRSVVTTRPNSTSYWAGTAYNPLG
jgi:hypothetical protein